MYSKKIINAILFSVLMLLGNVTYADSHYMPAVQAKAITGSYMVSIILKKNGDDNVVKLVHAMQEALSEDEAVGKVVGEILKTYQGYSIINSLSTKVKTATPTCQFI